ncbi:hypothetical protein [Lysinibacillus sp. NPDC093688]|uniref:hypothetical protein n=1 Tax=Lysinibacillus sp. NPDC093688 TaxID=3390577 RepID=UPI003D033762
MKTMPVIILLFVLTIGGIIGYYFSDKGSFWANSATIIGWVLFLIQTIISMVPQVKMFFTRSFVFFDNPSTNWAISVTHNFEDGKLVSVDEVFTGIEKYLSQFEDFKIEKKGPNRALYTIRGYMVRVSLQEDYENLTVDIGDKDISYRDSLGMLEKLATPLEKLQQLVKSDSQEYYISMKFKRKNPFIGVLINNTNETDIKSFRVTVKHPKGNIDIYNNSIELYASSIGDISKLSKTYLHVSKGK